jgi:hypothetical protein
MSRLVICQAHLPATQKERRAASPAGAYGETTTKKMLYAEKVTLRRKMLNEKWHEVREELRPSGTPAGEAHGRPVCICGVNALAG